MLDRYAVGFNPLHGFNSATTVHDAAEDDDGRPLIILYVGDSTCRSGSPTTAATT